MAIAAHAAHAIIYIQILIKNFLFERTSRQTQAQRPCAQVGHAQDRIRRRQALRGKIGLFTFTCELALCGGHSNSHGFMHA